MFVAAGGCAFLPPHYGIAVVGAGPCIAAPSVHGFEKMGNFNRLQVPTAIGYCLIHYSFEGVVPLL